MWSWSSLQHVVNTHSKSRDEKGHSRVPPVRIGTECSKPVLQSRLGAGHLQTEGPAPPNQCHLVSGFPVFEIKGHEYLARSAHIDRRRDASLTGLGTALPSSHLLPCLETEARSSISSRFRADCSLHRHCQRWCCHLVPILCQQWCG